MAAARTSPSSRKAANFGQGDFVLYTAVSKLRGKLQGRKLGPAVITSVRSDWVYEIQNLVTGEKKDVHAQRLEFYHDSSLEVTENLREHIKYHLRGYEVDRLLDFRFRQGVWESKVKWAGFDAEESTWESLQDLCEDVPDLVRVAVKLDGVPVECRRLAVKWIESLVVVGRAMLTS